MQVHPDPKPRKRIIDKAYVRWFFDTRMCIYCGQPAKEPHHDRKGYGDGKGSMSRKPDDYRILENCWECHRALEGNDKKRLKWMTAKIGREEIFKNQVNNLLEWAEMQGWDLGEIYEAMLDAIIATREG